MESKECAFCDPKQLSDRIIAINSLAMAFLASPRIVKGHALVVPRRHVELPSELNIREAVAIQSLIAPIHQRMLGSFATGVDIWQKSRPAVPQDGIKMDHVHYHLLPSNPGEDRYEHTHHWGRATRSVLTPDERDELLYLFAPNRY